MRAPSTNPVTLPFGSTSPPYGPSSPHNGVDFGYIPDTTIYAPFAARITQVPNNGNDGNGTYMTAPDGTFHGLLHASKYLVPNGSNVAEGQPIAIMGETGYAQGVHLHWAVKRNGQFIDGLTLLAPGKGGGDDDMIPDEDNYFARYSKTFQMIRGRTPSREEFQVSAVGKSWLTALEILEDDQEADATQHAQDIGQLAIRDQWDQQIYGLEAQLKASQDIAASLRGELDKQKPNLDTIAKLTQQLQDVNSKLAALQQQTDNDTATGNAFIRFIGKLFGKKS